MAERPQASFVEALSGVPLFRGLTKRQLTSIARVCFEASYSSGDTIVREGERDAQHMVVITAGEGQVLRDGRQVATVSAGDVVGEMALVDGMPRSASVVAATEVAAIVLYRTAFIKLIDEIPEITLRLLAALSKRLRDSDERAATLG